MHLTKNMSDLQVSAKMKILQGMLEGVQAACERMCSAGHGIQGYNGLVIQLFN